MSGNEPPPTETPRAQLEAELAAARRTISVLIRKLEQSRISASTKNQDDAVAKLRTRALDESEAQLRRKNEELRRLNTAKGEFISIAAHELRTPLTSVVGYLDMMHEGAFGELPGPMVRPAASLRRNVNRLRRLVDEMLDVSRIERGSMMLHRSCCDVRQIINNVLDELAPLAKAKSQSLTSEILPCPTIHADNDKIHQVVCNLIANAVRYTPESGRINVAVDEAPKDRYPGEWARIRVTDNGIGIPANAIHRVFEPFTAVNSAQHHTSTVPDSAGLGLYIARGLVDLHGGLISVDSEEGVGTEFTVLLPAGEAETEQAQITQ